METAMRMAINGFEQAVLQYERAHRDTFEIKESGYQMELDRALMSESEALKEFYRNRIVEIAKGEY